MRGEEIIMLKPKRKFSKVAVVGVTTHKMFFNCYCHKRSGSIQPYQRLTKRRKAVRFRSRSCFPYKYRFERNHVNHDIAHHDDGNKASSMNFNSRFVLFYLHRKSGDSSGSRQIRNTPDWSDNAVSGDHLWVPTSVSGDCCYVGDSDCTVSSSTPYLIPLSAIWPHRLFFRQHEIWINIRTSLKKAFCALSARLKNFSQLCLRDFETLVFHEKLVQKSDFSITLFHGSSSVALYVAQSFIKVP